MQRLAIAYGVGSLIGLTCNHTYLLPIASFILLFYGILLQATHSLVLSEDNIIAVTDRLILGSNHMYKDYMTDGTRIAFDPEGVLSSIGSIAHVLVGFIVGKIIIDSKKIMN
ncbi:MAG: hypothetical protein LUD02_03170 [Tannerellaceae bacterium]|nr:hypothetical protein [Tannerellaceae bacterium]